MDGTQMTITRRYQFKLYPTAGQAAVLHEQRLMMADLWNALRQRIEDTYRRERHMLSFFDLTNEITELRHECPEWRKVPAITAHRVAKVLTESYAAFFRRLKVGEAPGYPGWRSRRNATGIPLGTMGKTGWRIEQRADNPKSWRLHYGSVTDIRHPETWIHARGSRYAGTVREDRGKLCRIETWRNADILWRGNMWWLSICVDRIADSAETESNTCSQRSESVGVSPIGGSPQSDSDLGTGLPVRIEFDLIDCFAHVNGLPQWPFNNRFAQHIGRIEADIDYLKSERDQRWPKGKRRSDSEHVEFVAANREIRGLYARVKRIRANAMHVWTSAIVRSASDITIMAPKLKNNVKTPRGTERQWGAEVSTVSTLNRHTLSQAPGMAIAMINYKAEQRGIRCDVVTDDSPLIAVGQELVTAGKQRRRAQRVVKMAA
jgi:transposase